MQEKMKLLLRVWDGKRLLSINQNTFQLLFTHTYTINYYGITETRKERVHLDIAILESHVLCSLYFKT